MKRRTFLGSILAMSALPRAVGAQNQRSASVDWDYVIIGAGTAGLPAAIFASRRGAKVLLIDSAAEVGGTMHLASGQISAGGSLLQESKGIVDNPDKHYDDVMRMTSGLANADIVRQTADHAPATINWLLKNGLTPLPEHPETGSSPGRQCYRTPRYLWGANQGRDILAVVVKELAPEIEKGHVDVQLNSTVTELLPSEDGTIKGVRAMTPSGEQVFRGRHILITTGGYAVNPDLFQEIVGQPAYAAGAYPTNQGKGLELARSVGGALRGHELHRAGTGSILSGDTFPAEIDGRFITVPQERAPWEIWVNNEGRRFIREDEPLQEVRAEAIVKLDKFRYAIVFDSDIFESSPIGIPKWTKDDIRSRFGVHPMFHKADSLDELARLARINADGLKASVADYNDSVVLGSDQFGREHLPSQIDKPPFYAILHHGHSVTSAVGIVVDEDLRVVKENGESIPNLYAAGEVLGSGATLGKVFTPGMMLTPALTLGRQLGLKLPV